MKNKLVRTTKNPDLETKRFQNYINEVAAAAANNTIVPKIPEHSVVYSSTEHVVGTWIDGKPIYEKTVEITNFSAGLNKAHAHGISNIATIVDYEPFFYMGSTTIIKSSFPFNNVNSGSTTMNGNYVVYLSSADSTDCIITLGNTIANSIVKILVSLKYTKTTD